MAPKPQILPYSQIVGQNSVKLALELAYIAPTIGGVLLSGHRGTGKSTAVRAFALMMSGRLPVTLPINATEDRVIGGWQIDELMRGEPKWQDGLLQKANDGMLYVDEVNLLDDHIVNIILDVASTGVLEVQRDARDSKPENISFSLVGTMNPEEGSLRPQLLDRFGLMVNVTTETDKRSDLLETVLKYDKAIFQQKQGKSVTWLEQAYQEDQARKTILENAKQRFYEITLPTHVKQCGIALANEFKVEGYRNDYVMALATQANAALEGVSEATLYHVKKVAAMSIQHRRSKLVQSGRIIWSNADTAQVQQIIDNYAKNEI
jgi:magnesium chelatase subunit I